MLIQAIISQISLKVTISHSSWTSAQIHSCNHWQIDPFNLDRLSSSNTFPFTSLSLTSLSLTSPPQNPYPRKKFKNTLAKLIHVVYNMWHKAIFCKPTLSFNIAIRCPCFGHDASQILSYLMSHFVRSVWRFVVWVWYFVTWCDSELFSRFAVTTSGKLD